MEVLKQNGLPKVLEINKADELNTNLEGEELLRTIVDLTGLPEGFAQKELHEILDSSGESPETRANITLDELRAALIRYLETMDPNGDPNQQDTVSEADQISDIRDLNVDGKIPLPT